MYIRKSILVSPGGLRTINYPQLAQMRHALKVRIVTALGPDQKPYYEAHKAEFNKAIFEACNSFIKPTRRNNIIDKLALDIINEIKQRKE